MRQPTEFTDFSISTSASLLGESARHLQRLLQRVSDVDAMLQRLREDQYAQKQSVFDIDAWDAVETLSGPQRLPDRKLDIITGTLDAQWEQTYKGVLYDKGTSHWSGDDFPDGRLSWTDSLEAFRENNRADSWVIEWATDDVTADTVDGQAVLDFDLADGTSMRVLTTEDLSGFLDDATEVRLAWHPPMERTVIGELSSHEPEEIEVVVGHDGHQLPRQYTECEGPDSETSARHEWLLTAAPDPYDNPEMMQRVADIITKGYFTKAEQIRYLLFITGARDVIRVQYGYSVPFLIDRLAETLDAEVTHVPQTGHVLLSHRPLPEFEYLSDSFPDKQHLTVDEERELRFALDHPMSSVEFVVTDDSWGGRTLERTAQLFDDGVLSEQDVFVHQFTDYLPAPTEDAILQAVQDGQETLSVLDEFDVQYGTMVSEDIQREVRDFGYLVRNDW